jgi:branched-chain amino acid aminotransferase
MPEFAFFEGSIVPIDQAKVSIMTHAFNYGTGCFEGIRAYWNEEEEQLFVFRLQEHFERIHRSARILYLNLNYSVAQQVKITLELLNKEGYREDVYIRPLVYKSGKGVGVQMNNVSDDFAIFTQPFGRYLEKEEGSSVVISTWRRNDDNAIPARSKATGAYINSAIIKTEAALNGYDEAIVLNSDGHVSEGSAENLFIVRDGQLITPSVSANILEGITRSTIMQIAEDELGINTVERTIDRTELYVADEAFFCGTGVQIAAITYVDKRPVGNGKMGPIVQQIRDLYFDIVKGKVPRYREWCTPVYKR